MNQKHEEPPLVVAGLHGEPIPGGVGAVGKNVGPFEGDDPDADYLDGESEVRKPKILPEIEDDTPRLEALQGQVQESLENYNPTHASRAGHAISYRAKPGASLRAALRQGARTRTEERIDPKTGELRTYTIRDLDDPKSKTPREAKSEVYREKEAREEELLQRAAESASRINSEL